MLHELAPRDRVEGCRFGITVDPSILQPREELRCGTQLEEAPRGQPVVVTGGLIVQHNVVRTGNAHEVIAARSGQKQEKVVGGILIGGGVIRIADVATIGKPSNLPMK